MEKKYLPLDKELKDVIEGRGPAVKTLVEAVLTHGMPRELAVACLKSAMKQDLQKYLIK